MLCGGGVWEEAEGAGVERDAAGKTDGNRRWRSYAVDKATATQAQRSRAS